VAVAGREALNLLVVAHHYDNGFLPRSGGILDQANAYVEAVALVRARRAERARREAESDGR
jgi:hypothetical protein